MINDFFVAFSCRCRIICPSCSAKRSILLGEKVREILKPISHIHITFTIPKLLRAYFRRNRKLLKLLLQSAHYATETYFREALAINDGYTGGIFCLQSQGNLLNFHPHVHAIVIAGIIKEGTFSEQTNIATDIIAAIFRARLLSVLLEEGIITEELVRLLMSWNHNSGFNVHAHEFWEFWEQNYTELHRITYIMEFMALVTSHIPSPYEPLIYYYGVYSSSHRGKEKRNQGDLQNLKEEEIKGKRETVNGKISSAWARLIQRIFEIDILSCGKCQSRMRIIAFITNHKETGKILKHLGDASLPVGNHKFLHTNTLMFIFRHVSLHYLGYLKNHLRSGAVF